MLFVSFSSGYRFLGSTTALTRTSIGNVGGLGVHVADTRTGVPGSTGATVTFAHALRAQNTLSGRSIVPSRFTSTSSATNVTSTEEYTGTSVVTDAVVVRFVGTLSATGTGEAVSPVSARSGRSSDTVAPPYPLVIPAWISTRTPWLPTSVLAGV